MSFLSNFKKSHQDGFSLLELSIVLVILGMIGGISFAFVRTQMSRAALHKTRLHQDYVMNSIASFVEKNGRFPCPTGELNNGVSQISCRGPKAKGTVPYKTLGISEIYAKDGDKQPITYVVEPQLTQQLTNLKEEPGGFIKVLSEDGSSVISTQPHEKNPNYVAIVLISHEKTKSQDNSKGFTFQENHHSATHLKWESRDVFLKRYFRSALE